MTEDEKLLKRADEIVDELLEGLAVEEDIQVMKKIIEYAWMYIDLKD